MPDWVVRRAQPADRRRILRLCFAGDARDPARLERHVSAFLEYARAMSFDLGLQWVCEVEDRMLNACVCIESPGRSAIILLPSSRASDAESDTTGALIDCVIEHQRHRDICLLQALLELNDDRNRECLAKKGFTEIAILHYLELKLTDAETPDTSPPEGLRQSSLAWNHYGPETHDTFAALVKATYTDSLDCPGLSNLRNIEDVIEAHKAAGRFLPHRWLLLTCDGQPAACILLSENPLQSRLELVYMGVHPRFRRKAIARYILNCGVELAHREHFKTLTLAVDARNQPARRLYKNAGFLETHKRRAMTLLIAVTSTTP